MHGNLFWFEGYSATRLLALAIIPSLTAHTAVDLARQMQRSRGARFVLWVSGGSLAVSLGVLCTMELSATQPVGSYPMALPNHLVQAGCAFAGCVWMLVTLSRKRLHTAWVLASSLIVALSFTVLGNPTALFRVPQNIAAYEISIISFVVAGASSYLFLKIGALAKAQNTSWDARAVATSGVMGLLISGSLVFVFKAAKAMSSASAQDYLAGGLPLTALSFGTFAILVIVLAATSISRQTLLHTTDMQLNLDEQRMRDALADQRVTRLQNDALLQEIQERRNAEEKLRHAAFHDAATGLQNRTAIAAHLTELLEGRGTQRSPTRFAVILLHVDELKTVSSLVGHCTANAVLLELAGRLQRFVTSDHVLGRIGDDQFLLLMKHMPAQEHALRKANLMLSSMEDPIALDGTVVNLSASVGVCEVSSAHMRADDVLRDADLAAEVAKREGGRQCKLFDFTMRDEALDLQQKKRELKTAMQKEEFVLFYQPLVDMRDRSIYGMEALIRWNHPIHGLVSPGVFIPLAEETGQILGIGTWTLQNACREFTALPIDLRKDRLLSVNVSPRQFFETPFLHLLRDVLQETSMPPAQLQLEVTESIFLKDASCIGALLQEIRSMGVKIAFDDFGTGYSSLSYLTRYPIDTLKVDQSFVRAMNKSEGGANLVLFMMGLALEFNMSVTAEGVEEVDQEAALLKQGCCFAQGYLYSRPVPMDAMIRLLENGLGLELPRSGPGRRRRFSRPFLTAVASAFPTSNTH